MWERISDRGEGSGSDRSSSQGPGGSVTARCWAWNSARPLGGREGITMKDTSPKDCQKLEEVSWDHQEVFWRPGLEEETALVTLNLWLLLLHPLKIKADETSQGYT